MGMGKRTRASLLLAVALLGAAPLSVSAASPTSQAKSENQIAFTTSSLHVGVLEPNGVSVAGMAITATTSCYYAYWIAEARNVLNIVLFQYKEQVNWCANGTYIVGVPGRTTTPITPKPWVWAFLNEQLFDPSYSSTDPAKETWGTFDARGQFAQYAYPYPWPVAYSYPMVSITIRGNGTATGTISW